MRPVTNKKTAKPRGRAQARRLDLRLWSRIGLALVGLVGVIGLGFVGWRFGPGLYQSTQHVAGDTWRQATLALGLRLDSVAVTGRGRTDRDLILKAIGVEAGGPILEADPDAIRQRLEALDWIDHARVRRILPNRLEIALSESEPFALWQMDGKVVVIDARGRKITDMVAGALERLPMVVGLGANDKAREIVELVATQPALAPRIAAMVRVGARRWNLRFDNGVDLLLPETGAAEALAKFAKLEAEQGLLARALSQVDLRIQDKVVLRLTDEGLKAQRQPGKST